MIETINDLKKEFPEDKYGLIESSESIFGRFGSYVDGNFEINIGSPHTKGALQPVVYYELNKHKNATYKEVIKMIKKIINRNKFSNDLKWRERNNDNYKLEKCLKILEGEENE